MSSSMLSLHLASPGTSVPKMASTLVQPRSHTAASNWSMRTPRVKLSPIQWNSAIPTSVPASSTEDQIVHGLQVVARALAGAAPPTSIFQVDAIPNLQDIFKSWHLSAPPAFLPTRSPLPACPSMPPHEPPRVCLPLTPTPGLPWLPIFSWSPPLRPAASTLSSPAPILPRFQATSQWLDFSDAPSPRVVSKPQAPSPRVVIESQHLLSLPPLVLPTRKPISHCTCSRAPAPLELFTA